MKKIIRKTKRGKEIVVAGLLRVGKEFNQAWREMADFYGADSLKVVGMDLFELSNYDSKTDFKTNN